MAGLINGAMAQSTPQSTPPQGDPRAVQQVIVAALKVIHDPATSDKLLSIMRAAGDPVKALVQATLLVMRQLFDKSGKSIPADVLGKAGVAVMSELAKLAATAKLFTATTDQFKQAVIAALQQVKQGQTSAPAAPPVAPAPAPQPVGV